MKISDKIKHAPIMKSIKNAFIIVGKLFLLLFIVFCVLYVYDELYTREVDKYLPDYYELEIYEQAQKTGFYISEQVLRKRFSESSSSDTFIKVKLQNKETKEKTTIVTGNIHWFLTCFDDLKIVHNDDEYTDYMVKNYRKTFAVSDKTYKRFENSRVDKSYAEIRNLGWPEIKRRYLSIERGCYEIKNKNLERDDNFIAILLDQDVVINRNCLYYKLHIHDYTPQFRNDKAENNKYLGMAGRFEDIIRSETYIKLNLQNKQTKEKMSVLTKNDLWYSTCLNHLKIVKNDDEYIDYMVKNHNKTFEVDNKIYNQYKPGKINGKYDEIGKKGWGYVSKHYFDKDGEDYYFKNHALANDSNFLGMLLDFNIIVKKSNYDRYIRVNNFPNQ